MGEYLAPGLLENVQLPQAIHVQVPVRFRSYKFLVTIVSLLLNVMLLIVVLKGEDFFHHQPWSFLFPQKTENLMDNVGQDVPHCIMLGVFRCFLLFFCCLGKGCSKIFFSLNLEPCFCFFVDAMVLNQILM